MVIFDQNTSKVIVEKTDTMMMDDILIDTKEQLKRTKEKEESLLETIDTLEASNSEKDITIEQLRIDC